MVCTDAAVGRALLVATLALFLALALWVNAYPFIPPELGVPAPWGLLCACAAAGAGLVVALACVAARRMRAAEEGGAGGGAASREDWVVVGVSGATCGGKTTLATRLARHVRPACVLHQDRYFLPDWSPRHVRVDGLDHNDYDVLSALDMDAMLRDARAILHGGEAGRKSAHLCSPDPGDPRSLPAPPTLTVPGRRVLVLEGFTTLNYEPLYSLCDLRYYLVLQYDECRARRARRQYDPPDVEGYFERCVWPRHLHYREQALRRDVTVIDGQKEDALERVLADLRALGAVEVE